MSEFTPAVLAPLAWYDAAISTPAASIPDQMGGAAATLGPTTGADSADPTWSGGSISFDGVDDYVQIPSGAVPPMGAGDAFTVVVVGNQGGSFNDFGRWASFRDSSNNGPDLYITTGPVLLAEWGVISPNVSIPTGVRAVGVMSSAGSDLTVQVNNGSPSTISIGAETRPGTPAAKLGAYQDGAQAFQTFTFYALLTFTRQLDSSEIAQLVSYYGGGS